MSYRKGVSLVVGNVLMVLLVIVGVAALWTAVKPVIDSSASEISTDCITTQVEPVSCVVDYSPTGVSPVPPFSLSYVNLTVKRNIGGKDLTGINFIFEGNEWSFSQPGGPGTSFVYQIVGTPQQPIYNPVSSFDELETITYTLANYDVAGLALDSPLVDFTKYSIPGAIFIGLGPTQFNVASVLGSENTICPPLSKPIICTCITHTITPPYVTTDLCATINS